MKASQQQMLDTVRREARYTASYTGKSVIGADVMMAMQSIDRAVFIDEGCKALAYENRPLPIGYGQTISQPFVVALMTDLLDIKQNNAVLEIGTGSGYQAAILSRLARTVYSVERIPELVKSACQRFETLGYSNIEVRCASGYHGWAKYAPFDAIMVTAAATHIPQMLIEQLNNGGRMVIPVGFPGMRQELMLIVKGKGGTVHTESVLAVSFVPFVVTKEDLVSATHQQG